MQRCDPFGISGVTANLPSRYPLNEIERIMTVKIAKSALMVVMVVVSLSLFAAVELP